MIQNKTHFCLKVNRLNRIFFEWNNTKSTKIGTIDTKSTNRVNKKASIDNKTGQVF